MPARRILQLGDPLLRSVSAPVTDPSEAEPVFSDLRDTLDAFRHSHGFGRGISAVQIGEAKRLIYIEFDGTAYCLRTPSTNTGVRRRSGFGTTASPSPIYWCTWSEPGRCMCITGTKGAWSSSWRRRGRYRNCCSTRWTTWMASWRSTGRSTGTASARGRSGSAVTGLRPFLRLSIPIRRTVVPQAKGGRIK